MTRKTESSEVDRKTDRFHDLRIARRSAMFRRAVHMTDLLNTEWVNDYLQKFEPSLCRQPWWHWKRNLTKISWKAFYYPANGEVDFRAKCHCAVSFRSGSPQGAEEPLGVLRAMVTHMVEDQQHNHLQAQKEKGQVTASPVKRNVDGCIRHSQQRDADCCDNPCRCQFGSSTLESSAVNVQCPRWFSSLVGKRLTGAAVEAATDAEVFSVPLQPADRAWTSPPQAIRAMRS